jgi:hypothetical protein
MVLLLALSLENKQLKQNKKTEFEIMWKRQSSSCSVMWAVHSKGKSVPLPSWIHFLTTSCPSRLCKVHEVK